MPQSVILIARRDVSLEILNDRLSRHFEKIDRLPDRLVVAFPPTYVAINDAPSLTEDYEPEELSAVKAAIPDPAFFLVEYHEPALLKRVLSVVCEDEAMLVEDDRGSMRPCADFVG